METVHSLQAEALAGLLQDAYALEQPDEVEDQWQGYFALLQTLQDRAAHKVWGYCCFKYTIVVLCVCVHHRCVAAAGCCMTDTSCGSCGSASLSHCTRIHAPCMCTHNAHDHNFGADQ